MIQSPQNPDPWKAATFAGARKAQTREAARKLTPYERICWCCEMSEAIRMRQETRDDNSINRNEGK